MDHAKICSSLASRRNTDPVRPGALSGSILNDVIQSSLVRPDVMAHSFSIRDIKGSGIHSKRSLYG
jgi:hypothetical protein